MRLKPIFLSLVGTFMGGHGALAAVLPPVTSYIIVQPYQVCQSGGTCAAGNYYGGFLAETYAAYGIDVVFRPTQTLTNDNYFRIDNSGELRGLFGTSNAKNAVDLFLVESISGSVGFTTFGQAAIGHGSFALSASAINAFQRQDTAAHELLHALGLGHTSNPSELIASGSVRNSPATVISLSQLTTIANAVENKNIPKIIPFGTSEEIDDFEDVDEDDQYRVTLGLDYSDGDLLDSFVSSVTVGINADLTRRNTNIISGITRLGQNISPSQFSVTGVGNSSSRITFTFAKDAFSLLDIAAIMVDVFDPIEDDPSFSGTLDVLMQDGYRVGTIDFDDDGIGPAQGKGSYDFENGIIDFDLNIDTSGWQLSDPEELISVATVPETVTWSMMIVGFGLLGADVRRRSRKIGLGSASV